MTAAPEPPMGAHASPQSRREYQSPSWYQASHASQAPWPPAPGLPHAPTVGCRICGAIPNTGVQVRSHQGLLFAMRWQTLDGPFCSICGIALVREMTTRTLWQGWWSPLSLVATPLTLLRNAHAYRRLRRLPPPAPVPGRSQAEMGKPVLKRPQSYVALVPLIWAASIIVSNLLA